MSTRKIFCAFLVAFVLSWFLGFGTARLTEGSTAVDHTDYAEDQFGRGLYWWTVLYYEVVGDQPGDTVLVAVDTTDAIGEYTVSLHTGWYLVYAFSNSNDSTDLTPYPRKAYMKSEPFIAMAGDSTFFDFVKADSGFIGTVQGNIATADSASVAHKAHTANDFTVRGKLKEWPKEAYGAIPFVIRLDDGKDIHADWGRIAVQEGVPLTYYIITEELGSAGTMTRAEVCSVYGLGHEIGSHTCSGRNLVTLYAAGEYDSCITELSLSQTYLESLLHADADSFAEVRTFVFTGNAANEPLRRWAAKYYDLVSGTSGGIDYTATMESADLYNLRLWDAGSFIDSASIRAASGKTDSAWVADTLSALVAIWKDSSAVSGNYKNYGQRNIGGFYLHGESYTVGGDTLYSGLDTTLFRDMMQAVKTHADAGDLWLVTLAELSDWYRDNLNSIDNRWFTQNQYFSSVYHDADPFSDQVYQTNFRNYSGTQFLYENKYSATGNDSGTACMRIVNQVDGGYGIKYEDYGDGVALYALTGTSPANEGSQDGRAAMVEVRGRPGASALYAYCKDDSTYGVRVYVLPSIDDVPNTHAFYSNRGKHTFGTSTTDSTRMQTATVAGNITVGGNVVGDLTGVADSAAVATTAWGPADDDFVVPDTMKAATLRATGNLAVGGLATFDEAVQIDSALAVGVDDTGHDVNFYGATSGSRFFWNESKMSIQAGQAYHWDEDSTGAYSIAMGYLPLAKAQGDIALGYSPVASGTALGGAFALGSSPKALGPWTVAIGAQPQALDTGAVAIGAVVISSGNYSMALGYQDSAKGDYSITLGKKLKTTAEHSMALGRGIGGYLTNDTTNSLIIGFGTTPALFVGGANNRVGVNTMSPAYELDVDGSIGADTVHSAVQGNLTGNATTADHADTSDAAHRAHTAVDLDVSDSLTTQTFITNLDAYFGQKLYHLDDPDTYIEYTTDQIDFWAGNHHMLKLDETTNGGVFVNEDGQNQDFRVEGNADENLVFVDGSEDRVYVGADSGSAKLSVTGTFDVTDSATFGDHVQTDSTLTVGGELTIGPPINDAILIAGDLATCAVYGSLATAGGYNCNAYGDYSTAWGYNCTAWGKYSIALTKGSQTGANGIGAFSVAGGNATGPYSFASGPASVASGSSAVCLGREGEASGDRAVSMGPGSDALGDFTYVLGKGLRACSTHSVIIGTNPTDCQDRLVSHSPYSFWIGLCDTFPTFVVCGKDSDCVGINTTTPEYALDVVGVVNSNSIYALDGVTIIKKSSTSLLLGDWAGENCTGGQNTFVGYWAGRLNTTANNNTAIGYRAGYANRSNALNTYIGSNAGYTDSLGSGNVFIGQQAGYNHFENGENVFIGNYVGKVDTTGASNIFIGSRAAYKHRSGDENLFIGRNSGWWNITGSGNVFLGHRAGYNETGSDKFVLANGDNPGDSLITGDFAANTLTMWADVTVDGNIGADTVTAAMVGDLTGNATTASTCTTWTGAATKVDTNKAAVYRQSDSVSDCYVNATKQWGDASAPCFWEADTVVVSRCFVSANATGTDPWTFYWISCAGDTIAKHTSTTAGYWNWDTTMTAIILPTGGVWYKWEEKTTGTDQGRTKQGINCSFVNP